MMRVPGGNGNLLDAKAAAPTSGSSTRRSTRCGSRVENPDRAGRVLRGRLRDDRAVDRA